MASNQGQDVVLCHLCSNPVEHHCNLCHVDLCSPCTLNHLADKTNRHEIVEFINRKKGHVLPECNSHKKNRCELFCRDCHEPMCILCVTTAHKKHEITDIGEIMKSRKQRIIDDLTELENDIAPAYRNVMAGVPSAEFDKVLSAIQDQEDAICKIVRDIGNQMREKVTTQKKQSIDNTEIELLAARTERDLNEIILNSRSILQTSNFTAIMTYESKNQKFKESYNELGLYYPTFLPGLIRKEQIYDMFGGFQMNRTHKPLSLWRSPSNLEPSIDYRAFCSMPFKEGSQPPGFCRIPNSPQPFNFGTSQNASLGVCAFGRTPFESGFTPGGTPRNPYPAFGISQSGGFMGLGSSPPREGFSFGSNNTKSPHNLFGSKWPPNQSPNSNNPARFIFGNTHQKQL